MCFHVSLQSRPVSTPMQVWSLFALTIPCMQRRLASTAAPGGGLPKPIPSVCADILCVGHSQDLSGAEASLAGDCGLRLALPGYAASSEPRALHLDPLYACPQAGPMQCADAQGSHPEPSPEPAHPALRALSAPFRMFEFDFAAPPPDGRSAHVQVTVSGALSTAVVRHVMTRLASALSMHSSKHVTCAACTQARATASGTAHALVAWWELRMDAGGAARLSTAPCWISQPHPSPTQHPGPAPSPRGSCSGRLQPQAWRDHWKQVWLPVQPARRICTPHNPLKHTQIFVLI